MDIWTLLRTTAGRWRVALPIFVVALAIGLAIALNLPPTYTAKSAAVLTGPTIAVEQGEVVALNPYLNLGGSLNNTNQVLEVLMDSEAKREAHAARGLVEEYTIARSDGVMFFEVTGKDPDDVVYTATELVRILDEEIALMQSDPPSPPAQRVTAVAVSTPNRAIEVTGGNTQLIAVSGVLGLLLAMAAAMLVDGALRARGGSQHSLGGWRIRRTAPSAVSATEAESTVSATEAGGTAPPAPGNGARGEPSPLDEWLDDDVVAGRSAGVPDRT